jgi:FkbM family methyltransferase
MPKLIKDGVAWYAPGDTFEYLPSRGHEEREISWAKERFPDGALFIDVGANVGLYTVKLAHNFKKIVAVEPNPVNAYILRKNVELNNLENVQLLEVAAWSRPEMLFFNQMTINSLASNAKVERIPDGGAVAPPFPILGVPLDDYNLDPDFIKMDIEGGEFEAIFGLVETMERSKPVMLIEVHQFADGRTVGKFKDIMSSFGYDCTVVLHEGICFNYVFEHRGK